MRSSDWPRRVRWWLSSVTASTMPLPWRRAPIGIATGEACDLAKSAAAMALLDNTLARVDQALSLVRRASRVLRQNLFWALIYNALMLPAAILGYVHPIMAIIAMGLSSLSVTLNSARLGGRSRIACRVADPATGSPLQSPSTS